MEQNPKEEKSYILYKVDPASIFDLDPEQRRIAQKTLYNKEI